VNGTIELIDGDYLYLCDYNLVIDACLKDLFLKHGKDRKIAIKDAVVHENTIKENIKKIPQLVFEVSEGCNLRCKYCVYNGQYINQRALTANNMSAQTAIKGIDYLFSLIKDRPKKELTLSFYGGEPLLNVKTIKQIAAYGKKRFNGWQLRFAMTTNLTLLDDDILDFLVENNFSLLVSLDGDKENHDAKRVFANGKGSYDTVMKNLEKIARQYPEYFRDKIGFSAVYSFDLPLRNLHRFFTTHHLVKKKRMRFSPVNTYNTSYYETYDYNKEAFREDFRRVLSQVMEKMRHGQELYGFEQFLYNRFKDTPDSLNPHEHSTLAGTCLFDSRLYLDASGRFHVCEKINNTFPFGDVDNGFDFARMTRMVKEYTDAVKTHCSNCKFRFLCTRCLVNFCGDGRFILNPQFCRDQEEGLVRGLEKYITEKQGPAYAKGEKVKQFHQFVEVEQGPVNAAIIDLLKGNVYQVEKEIPARLAKGAYDEIPDFLAAAAEEELIIEAAPGRWVPGNVPEPAPFEEDETANLNIELHVESAADLEAVLKKFKNYPLYKAFVYEGEVPGNLAQTRGVEIVQKKKDFQACLNRARVDGDFCRITQPAYIFNRKYNPCWGAKIAVTSDGKIRPCIYSEIVVGDFHGLTPTGIIEKIMPYWTFTKDKVERCKDCEVRHICFDCREIAFREGGDLAAANPYCDYDPYTGTWNR
jgi:uncharacterized protein